MSSNKKEQPVDQSGQNKGNEGEQALPVHNPLNPADTRTITQEEIENEQRYKEALTERD